MPIVVRHTHTRLTSEFSARVDDLDRLLAMRDLRSPAEGSKDGVPWPEPQRMATTFGSEADIRLAVDTLKAVLGEIRKIKTAAMPKPTDIKPGTALSVKATAKTDACPE